MKMLSMQGRFNAVVVGASKGVTALSNMVKNVGMEFVFLLGWASVTWGVFGANIRHWAVSVGTYLILNALLAAWANRDK